MCTAISINGKHHLFGRTLDLERSYGEAVVITPQNFEFPYRYQSKAASAHAIIGIAHVSNGIPLYYDAVNEHGLCAAALNFPLSAVYKKMHVGKTDVASYELIPFVLQRCESVSQAEELLRSVNITPDSISPSLPATPLHWIFADKQGAIVAEPREDGLKIHKDPFRVLTNEPEFAYHTRNVTSYMSLSAAPPENKLCPSIELSPFSRGMGAMGLPGDYSSASRFVRSVFAKSHTLMDNEISGFFHVMDTVFVPSGCVITNQGAPVCTVYSSCIDADTLTYHFTTYNCRRIRAVKLCESAVAGTLLSVYPIERDEDILYIQ
ncbi:MAG: choloylglycine hydrolase family protein [Ruminococcaceae bacterium]|nr:choloylglycine hydrolase family protein [Oscillospiraceae bacterium]